MDAKLARLTGIIAAAENLLVAFSGGVDSTFLVKVAQQTLGERAVALTAASPTAPPGELESAADLARLIGCRHIVIDSHELDNPAFTGNPINRCFFCKDELYRICRAEAEKLGFSVIADGTNLDDLKDHRPGLKAAKEQRIRHPLVEAGMTKDDIRRLSRDFGLPTWDKPAIACLTSRFPYGVEINLERLGKIAACEQTLKDLGFREFRVRYHEEIVRIEAGAAEIDRLLERDTRAAIVRRFKEIGFTYVSLDLEGYRTGSMNEAIKKTG